MRIYQKLFAQHLGWTFKKHWQVQGNRVARDTGAKAELLKYGINVKDPYSALQPQRVSNQFEVNYGKKQDCGDSNSLRNAGPCYVFGNNNPLLAGFQQAQVLSKTIVLEKPPENLKKVLRSDPLSSVIQRNFQEFIISSNVLDAQQKKLPIRRLESRPNFNLPRDFGIGQFRSVRLLIHKMLTECERNAEYEKRQSKIISQDIGIKTTLPVQNDLLHLDLQLDFMISTKKPISYVEDQYNDSLPDLYPLKCTVSLPFRNVQTIRNLYPKLCPFEDYHPHTIIIAFNKNVKNIHGTDISDSQKEGRALLMSFGIAAAKAKQIYGETFHGKLPKPILIQCIQTDGSNFKFGTFQLNTLPTQEDDNLKNYWFRMRNLSLFSFCGYKSGRLALEGINLDVLKYFNAFYNNI